MESMKKANKKYHEAHKEAINVKRRQYYHERLANNEEYKEKKRQYAKQLYEKKKLLKATENLDT
jgi:hypothetical protein